ncbi:replication factor-a protein [Hyphopichia burtonii NRRL Y-1933]|uniref:Replication protein A subunit n=1 Tax=Hyphopichia burtonii NRRL Y-1933 TaxID=984485 RepID=A0A1E4RDA7_9ASCO|nr:replication factor-a protein [Hyphopichia burtonii NRRL Y-1933]ODV65232.1 replication factor-a protein [Hyphopichia burtonii NRRL Y-1933]
MQPQDYGIVPGSLKELLSVKDNHKWQGKPIVAQVQNSKILQEQNTDKKYRLIVSDGAYSIHAVVDQNNNNYLESNGFSRFSIILLKSYTIAKTKKRVMIINDLEVKVPKADKISENAVPCDTYYDQNPADDLVAQANAKVVRQPQQQQQQQQQQPPANHGPICPIESISPFSNRWTIKARVSYKGDMRRWSNQRGEGRLFNVNFLDESDEIRATSFNEDADKFFELLQEDKVYYVTKARVVPSKPNFSNLSHTYELNLGRDTQITECFDTADVPKINFNFTKLNQIESVEANSILDVIGVLKNVNNCEEMTAKSTGKPFQKRNVTIVDNSNYAIDVTLWNKVAEEFNVPTGSVLAFKGVKANDFGGRSLSLTPAGNMVLNPDVNESYSLKGWYDSEGINESFQTLKVEKSAGNSFLNDRKSILQVQDENLGKNEKPDYFNTKACINYFKTSNIAYPACINEVQRGENVTTCNRKIIEENESTWRCEKCNITYNQPHYRYIINCSITDHTGQIWVTLFDADAERIFKKSADEMVNLKANDEHAFNQITNNLIMNEYGFRIKATQDSFNNELRIRFTVAGIFDIDYNTESEFLAKQLESVL